MGSGCQGLSQGPLPVRWRAFLTARAPTPAMFTFASTSEFEGDLAIGAPTTLSKSLTKPWTLDNLEGRIYR